MTSLVQVEWKTKTGVTKRWQFNYIVNGVRHRKLFKKKPSLEEIQELTQVTNTKNPIIKDALKEYLSFCSLHCKASTVETYQNYIDVALEPLHLKQIKNVKQNVMIEFLKNYKENKAAKTYNNLLGFLKGFFEYFVENKTIAENPVKKIKPLPLPDTQAEAMNEKLIALFIKHSKLAPFWVFVFFMILLYMGLRISECIALNRADIDLINAKMNINKQYYRYRLTSTKNYATRVIDIPKQLLRILKIYMRVTEKYNSPLLFNAPTEIGKYISVNNIREHHFKNIIQSMENEIDEDLSMFTPHSLRHTHATYLLSRGIQVKYVSQRLGHRNVKTTLNVYNHVLPTDCERAINELEKIEWQENGKKLTA